VSLLTFDYDSADRPRSLPDFHHIDLLAHFDRERIPERVVCVTPIPPYACYSYLETLRFMLRAPARTATLK
jgi:catalase